MLVIDPQQGYGYFDIRKFRASRRCPDYSQDLCKAAYFWNLRKRGVYECPYTNTKGAVYTYRVNDECCQMFKKAMAKANLTEDDLAKILLGLLGFLVLKG